MRSGQACRARRSTSSSRSTAHRSGVIPSCRPQRGLYRLEWFDNDPAVEFHPSTSEMFALLRENAFELLDFRELFAHEDAVDHEYYDTVPADWAKRWPDEELWHARKRG